MGDSHICYDKNGNNMSYTFFTLVGEYKCGVLGEIKHYNTADEIQKIKKIY